MGPRAALKGQTPPSFGGRGLGDEAVSALQGSSHFLHLEELQLVVLLDVVVVLQLDAALETGRDLADVVLHPPHRLDLAGVDDLSLIHISEPTRLLSISYAVFCLKKK